MNDRIGEKQERWLANDLGGESESFEREILSNEELAQEIFAAVELSEALTEAADLDVSTNTTRPVASSRRFVWVTGLVAAMLAFVIFLPQFQNPGTDLPLRLRGAGGAGAAVGFEPKGELTHFPRHFSWHPTESKSGLRYRWELYDDQAHRISVAVVSDTTLIRGAGKVPADSLGTWLWLVVELLPNGLEGATSAAVQFTVKPKGH